MNALTEILFHAASIVLGKQIMSFATSFEIEALNSFVSG
jgi:hypothetical protein